MNHGRWFLVLISLASVSLGPWPSARASEFSVAEAQTFTVVLENDSYDLFAVVAPAGQFTGVQVTLNSGGPVDFWILDQAGLDGYKQPPGNFYYHKNSLFAMQFEGTVTDGPLRYLVVDNQNRTMVGAVPKGPVNYTAAFTTYPISRAPPPLSFGLDSALAIVLGAGLFVALNRWRRRWKDQQRGSPDSNDLASQRRRGRRWRTARWAGSRKQGASGGGGPDPAKERNPPHP